MTYTEVLELIRAGYKKEEIEQMMVSETAGKPDQDPKEDPKKDPKEDPKGEPEKPENNPPEPVKKEETETEKLIKALGLRLDNLTKSIQASNVNSIEGQGDKTEAAEDIIARLINPHYGEVK